MVRPFQRRRDGAVAPGRAVLAVLAAGSAVLAATASTPGVVAASGDTATAVIGTVMWIAVSPQYRRTGLVLASVNQPGCAGNCLRLLASHDGGATWQVQRARGWGGGRFVIGDAASGRDVVFAEAADGLQRSDDAGASWYGVGPAGSPTLSPSFGRDAAVAVASAGDGQPDYVLQGGHATPVAGSGGAFVDFGFMLSSSYPAGGRYAPAPLSAADRHSRAPVIAQCDRQLHCGGFTPLAGAGAWALPVMLYPSTTYADDGTVFARAGRAIYKSTDGGVAFAPLAVLPDHDGSVTAYPMLALSPSYSERAATRTLYVAALQVRVDTADPQRSSSTGGIFRSDDGGATWSRVGSPSPLDSGASAVAVAPDGRLFAGFLGGPQGSSGLLCSTDGSAWAATCPAIPTAGPAAAGARGIHPATAAACAAACGTGAPAADRGSAARAGAVTAPAGIGLTAPAPERRSGTAALASAVIFMCAAAATALLVRRRRNPAQAGRRGRQHAVPARRPALGMSRVAAGHGRNPNSASEGVGHEQQSRG